MGHFDAERPATDLTVNGALECDRFSGLIKFDDTRNTQALQAKRLARRYGLADHLARLIAELAFDRMAA